MHTYQILIAVVVALVIGFIVGAIVIYLFAYRKFEKEKADLKTNNAILTTKKEALQEKSEGLEKEKREEIGKKEAILKEKEALSNRNATLLTEVANLKENEKTVSHLSEEVVNKTQNKQQDALSKVINPFKEQIETFNKEVKDLNEKNNEYRGNISQHLNRIIAEEQQMRKATQDVTRALEGNIKMQGNWGEMLLKRVFEMEGWKQGEHYELQKAYKVEGDKLIPDAIIHLSEDRSLIVDAKMSFGSFKEYMSQDASQEKKADAKKHFLQAIQKHIKDLGGKNYTQIKELRSLDLVFMFLPHDHAFLLAANDNETLHLAAKNNITLISPTTLLGVVRVVNDIWKGNKQTELNKEFFERSMHFLNKAEGFKEKFYTIGTHLEKATAIFNEAKGRFSTGNGNMFKQLEDLKKIHEGKGLPSEAKEKPIIKVHGEEIKGEEETPEEEREEEKKPSSSFDESSLPF